MRIIIDAPEEMLIPAYATRGDAGLDLKSNEDKTIMPGERTIISTGIRMRIPEGYVGIIKDRSGLAIKNGLHCLAGVIDSGYRGVVGVVIINLSDTSQEISKGQRIAQMIVHKIEQAELLLGEVTEDSDRGAGGFGSTGK